MRRLLAALTVLAAVASAQAAAPKLALPPTLSIQTVTAASRGPVFALPALAGLPALPLPAINLTQAGVFSPWLSVNPFTLPSAAANENRLPDQPSADLAGRHRPAGPSALAGSAKSDAPHPSLRGAQLAAGDASKAFDNARGTPAASASGPVQGPALPAYLTSVDPVESAWLASVVEAASRSKTGRAVLKKVAALAARRGHPIPVFVERIGNMGEYTFDHQVVTMDADGKKLAPEASAHIFIHELQHVLQFADDLPVDALEMELEAHLIQFMVAEELGYKAPKSSFHWKALTRFKNDPDRFVKWLQKEYKDNISIVDGGSVEAYETQLYENRRKVESSLKRLEKKLARKRAIYDQLVKTQQPAHAVEQFRLDEVAPVEDDIRGKRRELDWMERDFALLNDPVRRANYERYARRVLQRLRALHNRMQRERGA